ncbi:MAG: SAM-dependent chlorinase/fluorinase [Oscillospiraceae bacterium]|nr:SAM-dependent chlorinase/fluorinase [Oscillospiraceae bacterium]
MRPVIAMQTDFGVGGGSAMRGTCLKVDPELEVYEITHTIDKFNVRAAGRSLHNIVPYWPEGTVFVSVVDPGVGTSRRASVALLKNGSYVVTPDNGTLTLLMDEPGIEAIRIIDEKKNRLRGTEKVSIFHGRDLFAYCAAKLAAGIIDFEGVGPEYPVEEVVRYSEPGYSVTDGKVSGYVSGMMRTFGNLESSIPIEAAEKAGLAPGSDVHVEVMHAGRMYFDRDVPYRPSFGWVEEGEEVVYNSSDGVIGAGINLGDFMSKYGIGSGSGWTIVIRKR